MRKVFLATGAAAAVLIPLALPAGAGDTTVTFSVAAGTLSISTPGTAALGSATSTVLGTSVSGSLGATTITDGRAAAAGSWTVSVSATNFTATGGLTINKSNASIYSGLSTATTGTVVFVPTTAVSPVGLGAGGTIASATGLLGAASVTYNPTITVTIPAATQAGDYSGTVTQTVA